MSYPVTRVTPGEGVGDLLGTLKVDGFIQTKNIEK
jgi:hypothetical protein